MNVALSPPRELCPFQPTFPFLHVLGFCSADCIWKMGGWGVGHVEPRGVVVVAHSAACSGPWQDGDYMEE